jgi:hypothetical protein
MKQLRQKAARLQVDSLKHVFRYAERKAPGLHDYEMHEMIDGRPLRLGEREKVLELLENKSGMQWDNKQNETRVAAAYVCVRLGLNEAGKIMRAELERGIESPHVRFMFEFALKSFEVAEEFGTSIPAGRQLVRLLEMRNSQLPGERRLAEIVLEKADIKFGTLVSW